MLFSTVTALLSALAVSASPVQKRQVGGVLICTGANATGECMYNVYELEVCHQLPAPYFENTNTFAPDGENFFCWPHPGTCDDICTSPTGCTFGEVDFGYENKFNMSAIGWDHLLGNFECMLRE